MLAPGLGKTRPQSGSLKCLRYPSRNEGASQLLEGTCPESCSEMPQRIWSLFSDSPLRAMGDVAQCNLSRPLWPCNRFRSTRVATHERTHKVASYMVSVRSAFGARDVRGFPPSYFYIQLPNGGWISLRTRVSITRKGILRIYSWFLLGNDNVIWGHVPSRSQQTPSSSKGSN